MIEPSTVHQMIKSCQYAYFVFHRADAIPDSESVKVYKTGLTRPTAVRYAWEANPNGHLYNREGLPAIPFKTNEIKVGNK